MFQTLQAFWVETARRVSLQPKSSSSMQVLLSSLSVDFIFIEGKSHMRTIPSVPPVITPFPLLIKQRQRCRDQSVQG